MKKSESITELSKAMAEFQREVKQPLKDANNPFFKSKYVPLENVVEAIHSKAGEHGLSFVQSPLNDEHGRVGVETLLMHTSGEWIEFDPVFFQAEKQTPQGYGALITYIKRYTLSAIFGITSDQDDDANQSSEFTPITPKQVGTIKTLAGQLASKRNVTPDKVYKSLNVKDVTKLSKEMGDKSIETLNKWLEQAGGLDESL